MNTMSRPINQFLSVALFSVSFGFITAVTFLSCSPQQRAVIKDVTHILREECQVAPVSPEAKDICVTEGELEKAVWDIVSKRKAASGASSAAPAQGNLVVHFAKPAGS